LARNGSGEYTPLQCLDAVLSPLDFWALEKSGPDRRIRKLWKT
jgi:hypothetical protein